MTDDKEAVDAETEAGTGNRPRVAVVWYGSLMAREEMRNVSTTAPEHAVPVKVEGFRRTFDQETSWRGGDGNQRGVANVVRDPDSWFNGLLVPDLDRDAFVRYRDREEGYTMVEVSRGSIEPYDSERRTALERADIVLVAVGDKRREDIEPKAEYIEICRKGAREWGEEFYADFLDTSEGLPDRNID